MIKLIVFDLDGTIVDSNEQYIESMKRILEKNGFSYSKKGIANALGPKLKATLLNLRKFKEPVLRKLKREINELVEMKAPGMKAAPYAREVLKKLSSSGKYKIALMTNSTHRYAHNFLHSSGFEIYFDEILGAEDFLDKDTAFHTLMREMRLEPSEVIYIGDKTSDYDRAKEVGCHLALVSAVSWDKNLIGKGAYKSSTIRDLRVLPNLLQKFK